MLTTSSLISLTSGSQCVFTPDIYAHPCYVPKELKYQMLSRWAVRPLQSPTIVLQHWECPAHQQYWDTVSSSANCPCQGNLPLQAFPAKPSETILAEGAHLQKNNFRKPSVGPRPSAPMSCAYPANPSSSRYSWRLD